MNFKTTVILIVLLIVVGGAVWFSNRGPAAPDQAIEQPAGPQGRKLLDISADHVNRLSITDDAGKRTNVEKTGGQWRMVEPVDSPAVEFAVRGLVGQITDLHSHGRPSSDPGDAAGLDKPRYRIELGTDDGKTVKLVLGNKAGMGDVMYARLNGGDINLVDASIDKPLKTAAEDLRDKHLLTLRDADIKQFRITIAGKTIAGEMIDGKWQITDPVKLPGDSSQITSLLGAITGISATEYLKPDAPDLTLAQFNRPTATVWVSALAPTTQPEKSPAASTAPASVGSGMTITIGAPDSLAKDHYFVKLSDGQNAKIASTELDALKKTPLDLRDRTVAKLMSAEIDKISILKQTFAPPATQPAAVQSASTQSASTQSAIAPGAATQSATTQAATIATRPLIVREPPKLISSEEIVLVKNAAPKAEPLGPALPNKSSTQASTGPTTVASTAPSTMPTVAAEEPSLWQLESDSGKPAEDSKVTALLNKFQPLTAERYLEKLPDTGMTKHYTVTLTSKPPGGQGMVTYTLDITRFDNDSAKPVGVFDGLTFEVPTTFLDAVDTDFHKGSKPAEPPARPMGMQGIPGMPMQ